VQSASIGTNTTNTNISNELSTSELVYDSLGEEGADYIKGGGTWTHAMFAFLPPALIAVTLAAALLWKR